MFPFSRHEDYHHVSEAEDSKSLMSDPSSSLESISYMRPVPKNRLPWLAPLLLVVSSFLACALGFWIGRRLPINLDSICTKHVSKYCMYHPVEIHRTWADTNSQHQ
jgi:hypothetical protein